MSYGVVESRFKATKKGLMSSLLPRPDDARWLLVLGRGVALHLRETADHGFKV